MFGKKKCRCGEKISDKYDFCPYCGSRVNSDSDEDFGMLGKNDSLNEFNNFTNPFFGGNMLNKMLGNAMRMLEKELQNTPKGTSEMKSSQPKTNFQLFINGKKINLGGEPISAQQKKQIRKIPSIKLPQNKLKNFSKLPKENPKTNIRRFSNKIAYEIEVPGVKSIKDVSIIKLENSIEIKSIAKDKAYLKIIPINFPIINYALENQKIIIELEVRG